MAETKTGGKDDLNEEIVEDESSTPELELEDAQDEATTITGSIPNVEDLIQSSKKSVEKSSKTEETTTEEPTEEVVEKPREKYVARERFDKVNEENKAKDAELAEAKALAKEIYGDVPNALQLLLQEYAPVVKNIHGTGGVKALEERAKLNQRERSLNPIREAVKKEVQAKIDSGRIDEEEREEYTEALILKRERESNSKLSEEEKADREIEDAMKEAISQTKSLYPDADDNAIRYAIEHEQDVLKVAEASHNRVQARLAAVAPKTEDKPDKPKPPTPMKPGGSGRPASQPRSLVDSPRPGTPAFEKWMNETLLAGVK